MDVIDARAWLPDLRAHLLLNEQREIVMATTPIAGATHPLVGKFFHTTAEDRTTIECQGMVEAEICPQHFLVQFFSFLTGDDTNMEIVAVANMTHWKFYNSADEMKEAYRCNTKI